MSIIQRSYWVRAMPLEAQAERSVLTSNEMADLIACL